MGCAERHFPAAGGERRESGRGRGGGGRRGRGGGRRRWQRAGTHAAPRPPVCSAPTPAAAARCPLTSGGLAVGRQGEMWKAKWKMWIQHHHFRLDQGTCSHPAAGVARRPRQAMCQEEEKRMGFDIYRKVPKDLTQPTYTGAIISICCCLFILFLFLSELTGFITTEVSQKPGLPHSFAVWFLAQRS
uniref:Endoplasmic reticulum-Golgi intermediate compartment protein n=1 Tax=Canis lupus familiaris TaxID=9615 RepID=A0A8I3MH36_CANLF